MTSNPTVAGLVTAVALDNSELEKWLTTLFDTCVAAVDSDPGVDWATLTPTLEQALLDEGFPSTRTEPLRLWIEANSTTAASVAEVTEELRSIRVDQLPTTYLELTTAPVASAAPADRPTGSGDPWADFLDQLVADDIRWDGATTTWDWFWQALHSHAAHYGVTAQADQLQAATQQAGADARAVLDHYGLAVGQPALGEPRDEPNEPMDDDPEDSTRQEPPDTSDYPDLSPGEAGEWVAYLRTMLLRHDIDSAGAGQEFDAALAEAVRSFQRTTGLPADGRVDRPTWDALAATPAGGELAPLDADDLAELEAELTNDFLAAEVAALRESDPVYADMPADEVTERLRRRITQHLHAMATG